MRSETYVIREHEEFLWLHSVLDENESYAGFIVPPAPPRPDFDSSREKLQKLGEGEATMTKEEFLKMKQELEQDYLAQFKKTVAMHEVFLQRIAAHPVFRQDSNFRVFLQYEDERTAQMQTARNSYLFDDGRCFVRRLIREGISDIYLDVITCRRCDSRMKITLRQGKFKGETRSYWAYRCQGCQSFRSLAGTQSSQAAQLSQSRTISLKVKRESKPELKHITMKQQQSTQSSSVDSIQEGGCLVFIPKPLNPAEIMTLSVRGKNKKEVVEYLWKRFTQSADEVLLSGQRDVDDFFENERNYLLEYNTHIKEAASKAEKLVKLRKNVAETYAKIGDCLEKMARGEPDKLLARTEVRASDGMHKLKKVEARSANDEELKLTDTLMYFMRDTQAAKVKPWYLIIFVFPSC
ncbi:PX domain protein [Dictyocaulus viviparus]|uniref:PX domain protein n=1 Tax=Dictyocaulus viviparus TaxID=29172 RepID=A0A0D8Y9X1_DICVI|nr:PX domain protein [Dictyocaulus viviparus]